MDSDLSEFFERSLDSWRTDGDHLEVMGGPEDGRTFPLVDAMVSIGRLPENEVALGLDLAISRRHAAIERTPTGYTIRDVGSSHGTIVDGTKVTAPTRVTDGSLIVLGQTTLCLRLARQSESR